jgi:hypothetical protein
LYGAVVWADDRSRAQLSHVHVGSSARWLHLRVVDQVPADMIGIPVDDIVISQHQYAQIGRSQAATSKKNPPGSLGLEIPVGAVAARRTLGAKCGGCQESEDDRNTQRSCLHTLPPSFRCRVLSVLRPSGRLRCRLLFFVLIQARMFRGLGNRVRQKLLSMPHRCTRKESQCDQDAQRILVINRTRL